MSLIIFTFFSLPSDFSANLMVALRTDPQQVTMNADFRLLALTYSTRAPFTSWPGVSRRQWNSMVHNNLLPGLFRLQKQKLLNR